MQKHDSDNACNYCSLTGYWSRACRTPKHFVELYQSSIKGKGKRVESHSIDNADDIQTNFALVLHIAPINKVLLAPIEAKSLKILNFLEEQEEKAKNPKWWKNAQTQIGLRNLCIPYKIMNKTWMIMFPSVLEINEIIDILRFTQYLISFFSLV